MKHFLIYTNRYKDPKLEVTERIRRYLEGLGHKVTMEIKEHIWQDGTIRAPEDYSPEVDCVLVLGGDGTVLQAAREMRNVPAPLIGVNLGTLGYMTEIEPEGLQEALQRLASGDYALESRMMLRGKLITSDCIVEEEALNDIVIARSGSLQIIHFAVYVNGLFLHEYSADGVIVTTPTGSTGYNLSAGGPLVEPKARLIMLTPICPHTLNQRSMILSPEDVIEIEVSEGRAGSEQAVEANFDGNRRTALHLGDRIRIECSPRSTEFVRLNQVSFLEILNKKLGE